MVDAKSKYIYIYIYIYVYNYVYYYIIYVKYIYNLCKIWRIKYTFKFRRIA